MERWNGVELRAYPCDLCGPAEQRTVMVKRGRLIERDFTVVRCGTCGHVWVSPRIPDERIPDLYDAEYYAGRGFDKTVNYALGAESDARDSAIVRQICETVEHLFPHGARIKSLDVGCGLGDLVLGMRDRGFESYGLEASPYAQSYLQRRGVPMLHDFDPDRERYNASFDLVTCIEVIEHVTSPTAFLTFVRSLLKPGGYAFILTGNWLVQRLVPGTPYIMPEGHIQYFTPVTLAKFFRASGLEPVQVPQNRAWPINRSLPSFVPGMVRYGVQALVDSLAPAYGPMPIAKRP